MPKFLFNISDEDLERLRQRSLDTGAPIAYHIRKAIHESFADKIPCGVFISGHIVSGLLIAGR